VRYTSVIDIALPVASSNVFHLPMTASTAL
jgi:hypothetical protein